MSSGAIAAGLGPLGLAARPRDLATQQAAASVGQGLLVAHYTARVRPARAAGRAGAADRRRHRPTRPLPQRAPRTDPAARPRRSCPSSTRTTPWPPTRSGSATTTASPPWSRTWCTPTRCCCSATSTRSTPARRRATGPGGSRRSSHAQDLEGIDVASRGSAVGTGGMVTKLESVAIATQSGVPVVLTSAAQAAQALAGEDVGTWFTATGRRTSIRRLWLAHAANTRGRLVLDAGAVRAVVERRDLAAARRGDRRRGHVRGGRPRRARRPRRSPGGARAGLVRRRRGAARCWAARRPSCAPSLGPGYDRELVHRDDLVLVRKRR